MYNNNSTQVDKLKKLKTIKAKNSHCTICVKKNYTVSQKKHPEQFRL